MPIPAILHGVIHGDAVGHELHQVLVRGNDGRGGAALAGKPHIGCDQIVGLEPGLFEARQVEGAHGGADQRELRNQVVRCRWSMRLVIGIELVAKRDLRLVEHDGEMGRPVVRRHVAQQFPQHIAEAEHGVDLQSVRLAAQRRQRVIGAENIGGTVHQKDMVAFAGGLGGDGPGGSLLGCFRHGRNLGIFAAIDSLCAPIFGVRSPQYKRYHPRQSGWSGLLLRRLQHCPRPLRRDPERSRPLKQEIGTDGKRQPPDRQRAEHPHDRDKKRNRADVMDRTGAQQQRPRCSHRQKNAR